MNLRLPETNVKLLHSQENSEKTEINKDRHVWTKTNKSFPQNFKTESIGAISLSILNLEFEEYVKDTNKCYLIFVKWFLSLSILNNLMILKLNTLFLK